MKYAILVFAAVIITSSCGQDRPKEKQAGLTVTISEQDPTAGQPDKDTVNDLTSGRATSPDLAN